MAAHASLICVFVVAVFDMMLGARGEVSTTRMKEALTQHFSEARHHETSSTYKTAAMQFLDEKFKSMGLEVKYHNFDMANGSGKNVIGILKGQHFDTEQDSIVAVCAHYDTTRGSPGVNDNGAGVVALLEVAREVLSHRDRSTTILFIVFDCEEQKIGSEQFIADWLPIYFKKWPITWKGIAVIGTILNFDDTTGAQSFPSNLSSVFPEVNASVASDGNKGDFLAVVGRTEDTEALQAFRSSWNKQEGKKYEMELMTIPTASVPLNKVPELTRGDHVAFWRNNLSAIFLTDTAVLRGYMKQCNHSACDNITHITDDRMKFVAKTARALISWVDTKAPYPKTTAGACQPTLDIIVACVIVLMPSHFLRQIVG